MNPRVLAAAAHWARRYLSRKAAAGIGIAALIAGYFFPEHALLADSIAGAMLIDAAVARKKKKQPDDGAYQ